MKFETLDASVMQVLPLGLRAGRVIPVNSVAIATDLSLVPRLGIRFILHIIKINSTKMGKSIFDASLYK